MALACLVAGCGNSGTFGAGALAQQAKTLQSEAAEGALLAGDAAAGRSTGPYVQKHGAALFEAARRDRSSLTAARAEPGLTPKLRALAALATRIAADLGRIETASPAALRALSRELDVAAARSQRIGTDLG